MNKEEDGGFSLVVLALAVVLYIAVLSMTFAGMITTRPTVGAAFLEFTKDYGSLLAGIPVLIAVLVAKQQLDATRRQHVAQIKRSFQKELDALDALEFFATDVINFKIDNHDLITSLADGSGVHFYRPSKAQINKWSEVTPMNVINFANQTWVACGVAMDASRVSNANQEDVLRQIRATKGWAHPLRRHIHSEQSRLAQYWS